MQPEAIRSGGPVWHLQTGMKDTVEDLQAGIWDSVEELQIGT